MKPFIQFDEPQFKNIPSQAETEQFEKDIHRRFFFARLAKSYEQDVSSFDSCNPDDLGYAYEKAFYEWCIRALPSNWSSNVDLKSFCKEREQSLTDTLKNAVAEHLERTGGSIIHFPYSDKRTVTTYTNESGESCDVILDPAQITADIPAGFVISAAKLNNPAKKEAEHKEKITQAQNKFSRWTRILIVSALIFCVSFFGTLLVNRISDKTSIFFTLLAGQVVITSLSAALISLVLTYTSKRDLQHIISTPINFKPYVSSVGFGSHLSYETYGKARFTEEAKKLHKLYRFRQLWGNSCCRTEEWDKASRRSEFYRELEPFIINGKDYIK